MALRADIAALEREHRIKLRADGQPTNQAITGHIDFLQVRNGAVHILDCKPGARNDRPFAQLTIYALALTRLVPGLICFPCLSASAGGACRASYRSIRRSSPKPCLFKAGDTSSSSSCDRTTSRVLLRSDSTTATTRASGGTKSRTFRNTN